MWLAAAVLTLSCTEQKEPESGVAKTISLELIESLKDNALDHYKRSRDKGYTASVARRSTVQWLLEQPIVMKAGISVDSVTLWVVLNNGVEMDISPK
jgi:hypothetical protein